MRRPWLKKPKLIPIFRPKFVICKFKLCQFLNPDLILRCSKITYTRNDPTHIRISLLCEKELNNMIDVKRIHVEPNNPEDNPLSFDKAKIE